MPLFTVRVEQTVKHEYDARLQQTEKWMSKLATELNAASAALTAQAAQIAALRAQIDAQTSTTVLDDEDKAAEASLVAATPAAPTP